MATPKVNCPLCGQEFPAYDQRGFRNAGFTAHHNRCLERQHQQQNESHQPNQLSSRASRFALAFWRRLLPALPTPTSLFVEGQRMDHDVSSLASTLPNHDDVARSDPPVSTVSSVPSQLSLQHYFTETQIQQRQVRPITRQRHTWNHWNVHSTSRRRKTNSMSSNTLASVSSTPLPTSSRNIRDRRSIPVNNASTEYIALPLNRAMTSSTTDSTSIINSNTTTALIIPPRATSYLPTESVYSPTTMTNNCSPFTFSSMLTTLPLASSFALPTTALPNPSTSNNSNFDYVDSNIHLTPMASSTPPNWALDYYSPTDSSGSIQEQSYLPSHDQYHQRPQSPQDEDSFQHQPQALNYPTSGINPLVHQLSHAPSSTMSTYISNSHQLVITCNYCRPQNGLHHPSCGLMQLFMSNIMNDADDTFPPT